MLSFQIFCLALNILMAAWHAKLIKKNLPILHGLWTLLYFLVLSIWIYFFELSWLDLGFGFLIRALVFDISLNLFRGLPASYQSLKTTSIWDKLTRKLPFWILRLTYLILLMGLNIFYVVKK